MLKKALNPMIVFGILVVFGQLALAHNLYVEPQVYHENPSPDKGDFSPDNPFLIVDEPDPIVDEPHIGFIDSQAIFSYLTPWDVDFFKLELTEKDLPHKGASVLVSASALPPACLETQTNYPVTALMGPGLPPPPSNVDLPFKVLPGMGVIVADNPVIEKGERPTFFIDKADPELELGIAWFLPLGLTQQCLLRPPPPCDFSNTIAQPVFIRGDYWIIMWDPSGKVQDYTANIGTSEENTIRNQKIEDFVRDNGHLHTDCHEPVNEHFSLKVSKSPDRSNPAPLEDQVLSGNVYIFVNPIFPESDITKVKFFVNGYKVKTEWYAPYDLRGTLESMEAAPLRTWRLRNGKYTLRADITFNSGGILSESAAFSISNHYKTNYTDDLYNDKALTNDRNFTSVEDELYYNENDFYHAEDGL